MAFLSTLISNVLPEILAFTLLLEVFTERLAVPVVVKVIFADLPAATIMEFFATLTVSFACTGEFGAGELDGLPPGTGDGDGEVPGLPPGIGDGEVPGFSPGDGEGEVPGFSPGVGE